jgi:RNA polymerase sigma factor (sigma-70 family)
MTSTERDQWESLRKGEINGLHSLYSLYIDTLYRYGYALCQDGDKVKDCIQDLFLSLWDSRERIQIPDSGKAYLLVSLRRRIFDPGPKSQLATITIEDTQVDRQSDMTHAESGWIEQEREHEQIALLQKAMTRLSDRQREIVHMKYFLKMEYEDIARVMDLNYQSARNLVTRSLAALRREMLMLWIIIVCWI